MIRLFSVAAVLGIVTIGNVSPAQAQWTACAAENGYCRVPYPTTVRYGAAGGFNTRTVTGGIACNNRVFGDPSPNKPKTCAYWLKPGVASRPPARAPGGAVSAGRTLGPVCTKHLQNYRVTRGPKAFAVTTDNSACMWVSRQNLKQAMADAVSSCRAKNLKPCVVTEYSN